MVFAPQAAMLYFLHLPKDTVPSFHLHGTAWQSSETMSFDVSVTQKQFYTRVAITGSPSFDQLVALVHVLGLDSGSWKHDALMVDLRKVSTQFTENEQRTI